MSNQLVLQDFRCNNDNVGIDLKDIRIEGCKRQNGDQCFVAVLRGVKIHRTNKFKVRFLCPTCHVCNTTLLCNLLKKLNKEGSYAIGCGSCRPNSHANLKAAKGSPKDMLSLVQIMDNVALPIDHEDLNHYTYAPTHLTNIETKEVVRLINLKAQCSKCFGMFLMKELTCCTLCPDCAIESRPKCHASSTPSLSYTSKFQLKFIKYCEKNNIVVQDGVSYGSHKVPFYLPNLNTYIDLKSNIAWFHAHKTRTLNCPNEIQDYIEDKLSGKYIVIYPRDYVAHTRCILNHESKKRLLSR